MEPRSITKLIPELLEEDQCRVVSEIWERYGKELKQLAKYVLRELDTYGTAEEIAGSALLRYAHRAREGKLKAWPQDRLELFDQIKKATLNYAREVKKRTLRDKQRFLPGAEVDLKQSKEDWVLLLRVMLEEVRPLIPEKAYDVGFLKTKGLTMEEIALDLNFSTRTAERHLKTFRDAVKKYLEGGDDE